MQKQGGHHWRRRRCTVPFLRRPTDFDLRKYSGDQGRDWPEMSYAPMPGLPPITVPSMTCSLGNEKTPEAFIGHLVLCYREVKRVLRDDGICWVIIGDNHNTRSVKRDDGMRTVIKNFKGEAELPPWRDYAKRGLARYSSGSPLQDGDLFGIPARLMFALQADGWVCRNENVWQKKAPMPSSVFGTHWERHRLKVAKSERAKPGSAHARSQDGVNNPQGARDGVNFKDHRDEYTDCPGCPRCEATGGYVLRRGSWRHTRAHETVLMLTKKMHYFADQEAVREPVKEESLKRYEYGLHSVYSDKNNVGSGHSHDMCNSERMGDFMNPAGRNPRDVLTAPEQLVTLRSDLTEEQRNYVVAELQKRQLL